MVLALSKLPLKQCNAAHHPVAFGIVVFELRRPFYVAVDLPPEFRCARPEFAAPSLTKCAGFPRVSRGESWVELDRVIEVNLSFLVCVRVFEVMIILAAQ